jgi:hypothetical protein
MAERRVIIPGSRRVRDGVVRKTPVLPKKAEHTPETYEEFLRREAHRIEELNKLRNDEG